MKKLIQIVFDRSKLIWYAIRRPISDQEKPRYHYQREAITHSFASGQKVLDIGSGGDPFPYATVLADRYLEPGRHRAATFVKDGKPVVICDIHALPFTRHCFDYVVCAHVLEHVDDPVKACRELQRVARAGFIETPTLMKDSLFCWAEGMHKWHIVSIADRLVFFEYDTRRLQGIRSQAWNNVIFGSCYHPLQKAFSANQDTFNILFEWKETFQVSVMRLDGSIEHL